ncbi:MBL fold metallo-hydrolase [Tahibacter soli]|jgi:glyoxylase-like metal-dependent hydrolase (beta-lactamase superfamily II)|uniref:MBL fold metallo-hydrolase n=1 Tax=Tahibacter soli TaxID=2983605 RepID=A0A9X3YJR8_9GAMM|nr:MBL fold metallo-hydrolase [Tahibacter soli]MDC8013659.1 MBL fold metallo-hydrolase [Tahibacter soli]
MLIDSFFHAATNTWSHVAAAGDGASAAIVDPVLDFDPVSGRVSAESAAAILACVHAHGLKVDWILETHAHADHLSAADWLRRRLAADGAAPRVAIGAGIVDVQREFKRRFGLGDDFRADGSDFDRLLRDGDVLPLGDLSIEVVATPGHTSDGVSYRIGDAVFVGDTLFSPAAGTGRCDFPGGSAQALYRSVQRLYALPADTRVFLCHDYPPQDAEPRSVVPLVEQRSGNAQLRRDTAEADFVARRTQRDATLSLPRLFHWALQVNIRAGRLPAPNDEGVAYLRLPLSNAADDQA